LRQFGGRQAGIGRLELENDDTQCLELGTQLGAHGGVAVDDGDDGSSRMD